MGEDISLKVLTQTTENIHRLFELITRIDERLKLIQKNNEALEQTYKTHSDKIIFLESRNIDPLVRKIDDCQGALISLDKRLTSIEKSAYGIQSWWQGIVKFVVQIVGIILAAYILYKLNLKS